MIVTIEGDLGSRDPLDVIDCLAFTDMHGFSIQISTEEAEHYETEDV